jgi:hypothetical protein
MSIPMTVAAPLTAHTMTDAAERTC